MAETSLAKPQIRAFISKGVRDSVVEQYAGSGMERLVELMYSQGASASAEPYYEPPYDPYVLVELMEIDVTHSRCVLTKAADSAGIGYDYVSPDPEVIVPPASVTKLTTWVKTIHPTMAFNEILEQCVIDRESIGWCALEIIRNIGGKVARLEPIPAQTVRRLKPAKGMLAKFIQIDPSDASKIFFKEFPDTTKVSRSTGFALKGGGPTDLATEVIFWPKARTSATRYYGLPDIIPAVGDIISSKYIRDYFLKFFDNNCIPRYAVVIKGGDYDGDTQAVIEEFFRSKFKGDPHKTLIISGDGADFEVNFERVDAFTKEADYRETRKDVRDFIRLAHGVPPAVLGITDAGSQGAASGLSQAEMYMNRIVIPTQRGLHNIIDKLVEHGLGITDATIRLRAPDVRNLLVEMHRDTQYLSHGVWSINEVRKRHGDAPIAGGDKHHIWSRRTSPKVVASGGATGADAEGASEVTGATEGESGGGGSVDRV